MHNCAAQSLKPPSYDQKAIPCASAYGAEARLRRGNDIGDVGALAVAQGVAQLAGLETLDLG